MSDTVKHSDDEEIVTLTYTWGQVKNFLHEHGRHWSPPVAAATVSKTVWIACSTARTTRSRGNCTRR